MKPKIHLVCNAHIDPVWLWTWHEGAAEAVSTFRAAVEFCENYDGFVFNHNESLLYEWVEEYEPELFERIKKQVQSGNWHIMGGWYLQPDTQLLSGESLIRQIEAGRKYFSEKFGVRPTAALSLDSFGHTKGLVQILNKTGFDSYIVRRFGPAHHTFRWVGFDDSSVVGHILYRAYSTLRGEAKKKIADFIDEFIDNPQNGEKPIEKALVLWGIGNHGGGASVPDIQGVEEIIKERPDLDIIQSTPEAFTADVKNDELPVKDTSIEHVNVGCYTSMVRIKQLHRRLENKIDLCEKISVHAACEYGGRDDGSALESAKKELMLCQFHDILPGSCIKSAEDDALDRLGCGITTADKLITKNFFKLCSGQERPKDGEIPIIAYNPHPYPVACDIDAEFSLASQNWNENEYTVAEVYDEDGARLASQTISPDCSMRLDWRKHITFTATLKPSSVSRFNCRLTVQELKSLVAPLGAEEDTQDAFVINNGAGKLTINKKTGLIDSYTINGKEYLKNAGRILVINDNEDPWGMTVDRFEDEIGCMKLMSKKETNGFIGYPDENYESVRIVENGEVRTVVQAFFEYGLSRAVVEYTIPKNHPYFDVKITMLSNDVNRIYKYTIDTVFGKSEFLGQTAFGTQSMLTDGSEVAFHQWCSLSDGNAEAVVMNDGTYAGSCKNGTMKLTLLRTPVYAAHPIPDRMLGEPERYRDHIDLGERVFRFRIGVNNQNDGVTPDCDALVFNQPPLALSFFTGGKGNKPGSMAEIDNRNIIMTSCALKSDGSRMIRLYNSSDKNQDANICFADISDRISFGKFEVKTFIVENNRFVETNMLGERL